MAYTTIDNPELYFQTKLYTGNGSTQSITLDGSENMQPDWVWFKLRDGVTAGGKIYDSVRGVQKVLSSNETDAESTTSTGLTAFGTNGFSVGSYSDINRSGNGIVAWNWKAGGSASSNSNGSITSSVSANTTAGFSIVAYTGNETAGATVGHGLGAVPQTYWVKSRSVGDGWRIYHDKVSSDPETDYLVLNNQNAVADSHGYWNDTAPTSSVFSLGSAGEVNTNGSTNIAYCFTEIKGFSKFFSYEGNSNSDGTFVYLGFRPAWLMVKPIDASDNWVMFDNKRHNAKNSSTSPFFNYANKSFTETTDTKLIDLLSNGFKIRSSGNTVNRSSTFVGMAFAESPLVNSNGVPNNAR